MFKQPFTRLLASASTKPATNAALKHTIRSSLTARQIQTNNSTTLRIATPFFFRGFQSAAARHSILPDSANPPAREAEKSDPEPIGQRTELSPDVYHMLADEYLETLATKLEAMSEGREDLDVENAAGILNIALQNRGTWVLNKQPPNKQLWLSSPVSGPKRYDYVLRGESMDMKADSGEGDWVYLRDGTSLTDLLKDEIGVDASVEEGAI